MELQLKQSKAVTVTCLSFPSGDVNNFFVGSEEGSVYSGKYYGWLIRVLERSSWTRRVVPLE